MLETPTAHQLEEEIHQELEGEHAPGLLQDPATWVLVPFLMVVAMFVWKKVPALMGKALDDRAAKISDELEQARSLREEAQEVLATFKRRQREAEDEAESIIKQAKTDAKIIAEDARKKMEEQLKRRTAAAEAKIARAEEQAIAEVRGRTAELSAQAAEALLRAQKDDPAQQVLIDKAIGEVRAKLN